MFTTHKETQTNQFESIWRVSDYKGSLNFPSSWSYSMNQNFLDIITNKVMAKPQLPFGVINFSLIRKKFQRELQEQGIMEYRIYRPVLPGDGKTFVLGSITLHLGPDYNGFEKILKEEGAIP